LGQGIKGTNVQTESDGKILDTDHVFEKVRWIRNGKDIDSWINEIVQRADNPFDGWNVKSQIEFVKLLQSYHAYPAILLFLRRMGTPNVKVCTTAMFAVALSAEYRYLAMEILDFMDAQNVPPTSLTFIALLGSVDGAKATSKTMKRIEKYKDVQLSAEVFNSAIFACKRKAEEENNSDKNDLNDWQMALNWLQLMRRKRIQPTVKTYHAILQVLSGTGQVQVAKSIMQQLLNTPDIQPDDRVWAAAMNVCAEALDYQGTIDFINEMQASGHRPNLLHASILLKALALSGQAEMSLQVLDMMRRGEEEGNVADSSLPFRLPRISPDRIALNTIISACAKTDNIVAALSIVERMKDGEFQDPIGGKTIYPDLISYHNILKSCRSPETAMQIVKEVSD
jgi:pentatricopeptide repeat protein